MSKKLSYSDKVALAAHQFNVNPEVTEVFVCANGQVFFKENSARNQDKEQKLETPFEKITVSDVEKEAAKSKKESGKTSKAAAPAAASATAASATAATGTGAGNEAGKEDTQKAEK